jgi:hypothetical protein
MPDDLCALVMAGAIERVRPKKGRAVEAIWSFFKSRKRAAPHRSVQLSNRT